jgi:hypothetical protein
LFISILGAIVSFSVGVGLMGSSGQSSPHPQAVIRLDAVNSEIVLIFDELMGAMAVIVFMLAGITVVDVVVATGHIELAEIQVAINAFLTVFLVFSKKFEDSLDGLRDSFDLVEFKIFISYNYYV